VVASPGCSGSLLARPSGSRWISLSRNGTGPGTGPGTGR
jgi:hypothetical protein